MKEGEGEVTGEEGGSERDGWAKVRVMGDRSQEYVLR